MQCPSLVSPTVYPMFCFQKMNGTTQNSSAISPTSPSHSNHTNVVPVDNNVTEMQPLIFLQTRAAQGIAGTFAFAAIMITCHQVSFVTL